MSLGEQIGIAMLVGLSAAMVIGAISLVTYGLATTTHEMGGVKALGWKALALPVFLLYILIAVTLVLRG